jgi:hypothetical protein
MERTELRRSDPAPSSAAPLRRGTAGPIMAMSAICLAPRLTRVVIALPSWVSATPLLRSAPALQSVHVATLRSRDGRTAAIDSNSAAETSRLARPSLR